MFYLIIKNHSSPKMFWNGTALSFDKKKSKVFDSIESAEKELEGIKNKFNYLKDLIKVERTEQS